MRMSLMGWGLGLLALPALIPQASAQAASQAGLDVRDLVQFERVSAPQFSPDGKSVLYALRRTDMEKNRGVNSFWVMPSAGGAAVQLSPAGESVVSPTWSKDGGSIYFLSSKSGSMQLHAVPANGGEAKQISQFPRDIGSYQLAPDGRSFALSFEVFADCDTLTCSAKRAEENGKRKATGVVYDELFVRHWDTFKDGTISQLYVARLGDDGQLPVEPVRVSRGDIGDTPSKPFGDASEYAFSPDSKSIVYSLKKSGSQQTWSTNFDLYLASADGKGEVRNLTAANPAYDTGPLFSADGKTLFYRAMKRPGFEADRLAIMALDLASGKAREIAPAWDRSADALQLSDDGKTMYALAQSMGQHPLFAIDIASGKVRQLTRAGNVSAYDLHAGRVVFTRDRLDSPAQIFAARSDGSGIKRLTDFNRERLSRIRMGAFEQFSFKGWNDASVYAYLIKPVGFDPNKKYPIAFLIHGGPQGSFDDRFHYRWNAQTYAAAGFAVIMVDFHGSTGYGQAFTDAISQHWGDRPLEDLQKGLAHALKQYPFLDGQRACALGGSYGGYMVNWIAGKWPDGFACLVSHAGILDTRMMGYNTEELWFTEWENGGTPYDVPQKYEEFNPVHHVANWKSPILVIHGQKDYRVLVEQGLGVFSAAQRRGIDSQLLYFPDENHWILKPHNSIQWHDTVLAWLRKHTK